MNSLQNKSLDIYQRVPTFETNTANCTHQSLKGFKVPQIIEMTSFRIFSHIQDVSMGRFKTNKAKLIFKMDNDSKIWFLGVISLRIEDRVE